MPILGEPTISNVPLGAFSGLFDIVGGRALKGSFIKPVEFYRSVRTEESLGPIVIKLIELLEPFKALIVELRPMVTIGSGDSGDWGIAARTRARTVCGAIGVA